MLSLLGLKYCDFEVFMALKVKKLNKHQDHNEIM